MGGKHLKRLRAEKAKVKLKGKKLPKGQNITDTTFKVKKITLIEQLKKAGENEPVSSRNLTLKDSLTHLNHYNASSRFNGLIAVEELILKHFGVVEGENLRLIITGVLEIVNDVEHKLRKAATDLLNTIFYHLSGDQITPFYEILNVHLGCAMTHIDIGVQKDSLKLLDVIAEHAPDVIKKNYKTIVRNFIRILSGHRHGTQSEMFLLKGSKNALATSKIRVLTRLYQIFKIVYNVAPDNAESVKEEIKATEIDSYSLRLLNKKYKELPYLVSLFKPGIGKTDEKTTEVTEIQSQISTVMPLLFEIWLEFSPNKQNDGFSSESIITEDAGNVLMIILKIMMLFYENILKIQSTVLKLWFINSYRNTFCNAFLQNFPFMPPVKHNKSAGIDFDIKDVTYANSSSFAIQNLIICYFYYNLNIRVNVKEHESRLDRYIISALQVRNGNMTSTLVKVVSAILLSPGKPQRIEMVLSAAVKAYLSSNSAELRRGLFPILKEIALKDELIHLHQNKNFINWMMTLPSQLCKNNVPLSLVQVILKLACRQTNASFLKEIENRSCDIVRLLPNVQVTGINQFQGQKLIADIVYWCSIETIKTIVKKRIIEEKNYPSELRSYFIDVLSKKLNT